MPTVLFRPIAVLAALGLLAASCGDEEPPAASESDETGQSVPSGTDADRTVVLLTHDSFVVSPETFAAFTAETGIAVEQLALGDAGQLVSEAVLTVDEPLGDVLFGIDNTFLQRGLDADLFEPYEATGLDSTIEELRLDDRHRVTPIDFGDVCINYWLDALDGDPPETLDDLLDDRFMAELVVPSPETSSPGLAFLLATVAAYGDGWEQYWEQLADNGISVTSGWSEAYYGDFVAGGGDRALVVSYASSPPAEVIFASEPIDTPPTGVMTDSCYRQVEFAGILSGTERRDEAEALIDFMLSPTFQADVPLNMFVFPAVESTPLPDEFVDHVVLADDPHMLDPAEVEQHRDEWTERWVEIVLR